MEVDSISGRESQRYPDAYPKEYRERVENFSRNYIWRKITGGVTIEFLEATVERMGACTTSGNFRLLASPRSVGFPICIGSGGLCFIRATSSSLSRPKNLA
jgi:hypothetical protein